MGDSDKHIFPTDLAAVALAAVQRLNRDVQELKAENEKLRKEVLELKEAQNSRWTGTR